MDLIKASRGAYKTFDLVLVLELAFIKKEVVLTDLIKAKLRNI